MNKVLLHNTLSREKEEFTPIDKDEVRMYTCGPTVYNYPHIGNLRAYVFADTLRRTLEYNGYKVRQIMNITDVGHLQSDADDGEDKMTLALKREGKALNTKSMRELADRYFEGFKKDLESLNVEFPEKFPFASDHITEQVDLIKKLEVKGLAYETIDGIYFDTKNFPAYGKLGGTQEDIESRVVNPAKKDPRDFALWKYNNDLGYESPIGKGFPGWHIECSAMSMKYLGDTFDIHTGGVDHIPVHHNNEIAQSEGATGKPLANYWLHNEWLLVESKKMAKSLGNVHTLRDITEKGIAPASFRFWLLMAHYRSKMNFVWEALEASQVALKRLQSLYLALGTETGKVSEGYQSKFREYVSDDLNTPRALSLLWDLMKDENIAPADKRATVLDFDKVLGLGFADLKEEEIPEEIMKLVQEREAARANKDFKLSDDLRVKINSLGWEVKDTAEGQKISKT